jgi:hypothetical protein
MATTYEDPRAHALRAGFLAAWGGPEIPVPVEEIADWLGLHVEDSSELGDCSGILLPVERRILLNAAERVQSQPPMRRRRFTIAHELGHWICHCAYGQADRLEPTYCRQRDLTRDADRAVEREANVFAAELLLPEPAVRAAWAGDIDACADRFDVSPSAMHWRLYNFGLVDERP